MRSELIVELVKAGVSGNQDAVRVTAEAIAAEERAKKHTGVADRIAKAVSAAPVSNISGRPANGSLRVRDGSGGIDRRHPERALSHLRRPR